MFTTLLESRHARQWHTGGLGFSTTVHVAVISLLTMIAGDIAQRPPEQVMEAIHFAQVAAEKPPEPAPEVTTPPPDVVVAPPIAKGFQVLVAPVQIPTEIPAIDLTKAATDEADFSGRGVAGGVARGVVGGAVPKAGESTDRAYFEFQVERGILELPGAPTPRYPEMLRQGGVEGTVLAQFVVDTLGRVEPGSFKVLRTTHPLFADAVSDVLPRLRFAPAETGGRKVRMVAQQAFEFTLSR